MADQSVEQWDVPPPIVMAEPVMEQVAPQTTITPTDFSDYFPEGNLRVIDSELYGDETELARRGPEVAVLDIQDIYSDGHYLEPYDADDLEDLDKIEADLLGMIAQFEKLDLYGDGMDRLAEWRENLASIPERRQEMLDEQAEDEAEMRKEDAKSEKECNGSFERRTGNIVHIFGRCPIHS